jgi:hypothetical protein
MHKLGSLSEEPNPSRWRLLAYLASWRLISSLPSTLKHESTLTGAPTNVSVERMDITAALLAQLWHELGGQASALGAVQFRGEARGLPSVYEVSVLASGSIAAATLAVAELQAVRSASAVRAVSVERAHADAAFIGERLLSAVGWQLPEVWDPIAGDYATRDGFIRLHTNYSYHRDAALRVLELPLGATREQVKAAVNGWDGEALEQAVVAAQGCAAKLRSPAEWAAHPQGQSLLASLLFDTTCTPAPAPALAEARAVVSEPLAGVRVLDLTRVIAGPIGTRFLAAFGADVLRVDPPGFEEVAALLCDITAGKRRCALDLRDAGQREQLLALVQQADVIVHGYRGDALARQGLGNDTLRALNPNAVIVCHDAYGWSGPWAGRRGFDSLVQMSCGIAWRGREVTGNPRPTPLPAQALDHATGYLIAAAVACSLTRRIQTGEATLVRLSLARTARLLMELGDLGEIRGTTLQPTAANAFLEEADTSIGRVRRVRCPGNIAGVTPAWRVPAGQLGVDPPRFQA